MQDLALLATKFSLVDMFVLLSFHKLIGYFEEKIKHVKMSFKTIRYVEFVDTGGSDRTKILYNAIAWYMMRHTNDKQDYESSLISPVDLNFVENAYATTANPLKADEYKKYTLIKRSRPNQWCRAGDVFVRFSDYLRFAGKYKSDRVRLVEISADSNQVIDEFLDTCLKEMYENVILNKNKRVFIYWREKRCMAIPLIDHSFDDVFFEGKDTYVKRVQKYHAANKSCVILLTGKPGTGKTSTIKATASLLRRSLVEVKLNRYTLDTLNSTDFGDHTIDFNRSCYVLEDIDALSDIVMERSEYTEKATPNVVVQMEKPEPDLTLSELLNALDGVMDTPGRFIFITTNYPEKLDTALIRPGRVNVRVDFAEHMPHDLVKQLVHRKFPGAEIPVVQKSAATWANLIENCDTVDELLTMV